MPEPKQSRPLPHLTDALVIAISRLFSADRDPSHSAITLQIERADLVAQDPIRSSTPIGKERRVRHLLTWCVDAEPAKGASLAAFLIESVRGNGGFREMSANYVGVEQVANLREVLRAEGFDLASDGQMAPLNLDTLSGTALTDALLAYARRAQRGATDAALVAGTSKDLIEAAAAFVLAERTGAAAPTNFPTLLGQAFIALGLATTHDPAKAGERPERKLERALFEAACAVNALRNKDGTGHGRPFLPTLSDGDARTAAQTIGVVAAMLIEKHRTVP